MSVPRQALRLQALSPVAAALELLALGTGLVLVMVLLARLPSWRAELGGFQALYAVAFLFYAIAIARAERCRHARYGAGIVFVVAIAARVALLPVTPSLSDDVYRYLWEGRVAARGGDPYRHAPLAAELAALQDARIFPRINHPELATIYPPLSVAGFALVTRLSPTVWAMKVWIVLHDLALVALLLAWMQRRGRSPAAATAYAWCPLAVVEFAGSGHNDPTALVWLVAALMAAERRPSLSALALAAGALTKLAPLAAAPFLVARWPWRARLLGGTLLASGLGWFWVETRGSDSGLTAYWRTWRNNELVFHYLAQWTGNLAGARALASALVAVLVAALLWRGREAAVATRATLRAGLLVSPVAHPWYFAWPVALEPIAPTPAWLLLSLTSVLSYGLLAPPLEGGRFHLPLGWRWVEYGVPLLLAGALALWSRRRATPRDGAGQP